jgi:hypothetical protein
VSRALDLPRVRALMNSPVVVHLRNVCEPEEMTREGFAYTCIGRGMLGRRHEREAPHPRRSIGVEQEV